MFYYLPFLLAFILSGSIFAKIFTFTNNNNKPVRKAPSDIINQIITYYMTFFSF